MMMSPSNCPNCPTTKSKRSAKGKLTQKKNIAFSETSDELIIVKDFDVDLDVS